MGKPKPIEELISGAVFRAIMDSWKELRGLIPKLTEQQIREVGAEFDSIKVLLDKAGDKFKADRIINIDKEKE